VRFPSGSIYKWEFEKRGEQQSIDVSGSLTLDSHHLMLEAALQGAGIVWTNDFAASAHIASGKLMRVLEDWTPSYPGLRLYYPANRHMPAGLRAFVNVVRELVSADSIAKKKV
jgi:DNA-binding transcriptional LysR family regulator